MSSSNTEIESIAEQIKSGKIKRIVALVGAGISTSAGIPDFRSPTTGLYDKLAPLRLPYPEALFHISYFRHTPEPFYALARGRHPRNLKPTISHAFLALLAKRNLLHFLFTQNIDGLESDAGVPGEKLLHAHGTWKSQRCFKCQTPYPDGEMKKAIELGEVPYCPVADCGGAVKPDIVFFGEALPEAFVEKEKEVLPEADLMLVMGTSLKVAPISQLPCAVGEHVPRVLVNNEVVGDFGKREKDIIILGSCDEGATRLARSLGWEQELDDLLTEATEKKENVNEKEGWDEENGLSLDECIARAAEKIKMRMGVSDGHRRMLESHLGEKMARIG